MDIMRCFPSNKSDPVLELKSSKSVAGIVSLERKLDTSVAILCA